MSKMAASNLHNSMRTVLFVSLLGLAFSLDEGHTQRVQHKPESHRLVQVSSLLPSASCTSSAIGGIRKSSLEVVHKQGPCFAHARAKPNPLNHTKILVGDQSRVNWIQSVISTGSASSKVALPARFGILFGSAECVVTIGIGSRKSNITLFFDTGSDLTWTQCEPCLCCYTQSETIFNSSISTSYANMPCTSPRCNDSGLGFSIDCPGSTCNYQITYADESLSLGNLAEDTLTLTSTDVIENFIFGCGRINLGNFGEVAGVLGLAWDGLSIVEQTAGKYGRYFSYCLPSSCSSTGHLTFGNTGEAPAPLPFTPIAPVQGRPFLYGISIVEIEVAGITLQIPSTAEAIIDSGTVITRLAPTVYRVMRMAFRKKMKRYKRANNLGFLDTCYDFRDTEQVVVPRISFTFSGGAFVDLPQSGILYVANESQVCLAFAPNSDDTETIIYGNVQQKTFEVIYDVAGGQLGFAPDGCP